MAGLVSATIGNANIGVSLGDAASAPMFFLVQVVGWSVFVPGHVSGDLGR